MNFFKKSENNDRLVQNLQNTILENQEQLARYINKFLQNEEKWKQINYLVKNINSTLEISELTDVISTQLEKLVGSELCSIYGLNEDKHILERKYVNAPISNECVQYIDDYVFEKNKEIKCYINSDLESQRINMREFIKNGLNSSYVVEPIYTENSLSAVIFLYKKGNWANEEEKNILQLVVENISMSLRNSKLYEKLKQANKNQVEFIAGLSHEFKTPLNTIIGFSELLQNSSQLNQSEIDKYAQNIYNCSKHLLRLMIDIQDASIAESGNINLNFEKFNTKTIINDIVDEFESLMTKKV
ncbi:MAG: GAF domain-containing sensor histidine kinase [Candidatus Gastranaerophilales bacterium]|nr:GAF domain-containing sensor histidine kinase [Candidatus Gastranaerophilales bacterium]